MTPAGERNKKINLQVPTKVRGLDGSETVTYTTLTRLWVKIDSKQGREFWAAQQVNSEITHLITGTYRTGLRPDFRFKYGNRVFEILSYFSPEERLEELVYRCKEVLKNA